jgi:hypothetical protein
MSKMMILAAAMLTFGAGAAFADGDVFALPAQTTAVKTAPASKASDMHTFFTATPRNSVSVYDRFSSPGTTQGGEN